MTVFTFDAKAALERAKNRQIHPNLPNCPNRSTSGGPRLGGLGRLGAVRASDPEMTPAELIRDIFEERAAIREYCGGQDRETAEREARAEAKSGSKVISLRHWIEPADDITNPDVWR